MSVARFEVVVIGSGVTGGSIAYHLARQGREVLVVERPSRRSSRALPGGAPAACAARGATRPRRSWRSRRASAGGRWKEELDADLEYRHGGNLYLGEGDAKVEQVARFVERQHANGFADVRFVDRKEVLEIVPGLNDRVSAGSYNSQDGQANLILTTRALAAAAQRHGATYWNSTETVALLQQDDRVTGVLTDRGDVAAEAIVLAAGAWSDELAAAVGLCLPIRARAPQILISSPAPAGTLRPVLGSVSRRLSLKQLPSGEFMLGGGWPGEIAADRRSSTMLDDSIRGSWATASGLLPAVGRQRVVRRWCGIEAQSIDDIPFIGPAPGLEGLTVAAGFSGHGFAICPAVGRVVADQLAGRPTPELDGLSPDRIAGFDPVEVQRFLAYETGPILAAG